MSAIENLVPESKITPQIATVTVLNDEVESSLDFYVKNAQSVAEGVYHIVDQFMPKPRVKLVAVDPICNQHHDLLDLLDGISENQRKGV